VRFLLIDRILELESGKRAVGIKNITMSEEFLAYHFPDMPVMPGVLIGESMVQLADWIIREHTDFKQMGLVTAFDRMRFRKFARPGDQLCLKVDILSWEENEVTAKGKALRGDKMIASMEFTLALVLLESLLTLEEARQHFGLIYKLPEIKARLPF
jgi:3-hydroxyacyl-[acyl-carrier-protein] dehydratase